MREYKKTDRWIDLDKLPRCKNGRIDWRNSYGIRIPFKYDDIIGTVEILEHVREHKYNVVVYVGDVAKKYCMSSSMIGACNFGGVLKQPIGETHPDLIKYFVNQDDAFRYSAHCKKKVSMICPICGFKKQRSVGLLSRLGFACPRCSDGKSWAEKFMFNVLMQLNVDFCNEVSKKEPGFEWVKDYRYDFYVKLKKCNLLIEMDGHFHDGSCFYSYEETRHKDVEKDSLASKNGFNLVRIDCKYPDINQRFEYVKQSIIKSDLHKLFDLSIVNWDIANEYSLDSYIKQSADLFNQEISIAQISQILGLSKLTVNKYLKIATEIGWCNYITINRKPLKSIMPIALYKKDQLVGVFISAGELDRKSQQIYGIHFNASNIHAACNGINNRKHVRGYTPKYITYQEYLQLLPQFSTIQN